MDCPRVAHVAIGDNDAFSSLPFPMPAATLSHPAVDESLKLDYIWVGLCLLGAVYFVFRA